MPNANTVHNMGIAFFCVKRFASNLARFAFRVLRLAFCINGFFLRFALSVPRLAFFEYIRMVNDHVKIFYSYLAYLRSACANVP